MIHLRAVGVGTGVTLAIVSLSVGALGVLEATRPMIVAGVVGGIVTAIAVRRMGDTDLQTNVRHGFHSAGLAGILIFGVMLVLAMAGAYSVGPPTEVGDNPIQFLTNSPLIIPTFAVAGAFGGLLESLLHYVTTW